MSDDHDRLAISAYNKTLLATPNIDRIAKEGMLFRNAFVGNSICGPARATLLTGQHSHKNGQVDNRIRFDSSKLTMPKMMQKAGYETAIVGKWHLHSYPAGFSFWKILPGQGQYYTPRFIHMSGDSSNYPGYATDVITDQAIEWLDKRNDDKPFMMLLHHKAPHRNFLAPLKYIRQFQNVTVPEPSTLYLDAANRGEAWKKQTMSILEDMRLSGDLKVDPEYLMDIPALKPTDDEIAYYRAIMNRIPEPDRSAIKELYKARGKVIRQLRPTGQELLRYKYQWYMQDYLACVASVDENIGRILNYLDQNQLTQNTVVIYTSDQGMYLGQNGWFDKRFMYDVSMRTPLMVRWPGKIKPGSINDQMVQNIDYAPTFLDMAGVKTPAWMQGLSFKQVLINPKSVLPRQELYYRFYEYYADHSVLPHLGIRSRNYKLIYFYTVDEWELYDLKKDPDEIHNLYNDTKYRGLLKQMKEKLIATKKKYDDREGAGVLR